MIYLQLPLELSLPNMLALVSWEDQFTVPQISLAHSYLILWCTPFLIVWFPLPDASSLSEFIYPLLFSSLLPLRRLFLHHSLQWFHSGLNVLSIQERYYSFGIELRLLWTYFFFYLFMLVLLLLWKGHRIQHQTDVGLSFRSVIYWPWDPV